VEHELIRRLRETAPQKADEPDYSEFVPEAEPSTVVDDGLDGAFENIDIIDAYVRWCAKMTPDPKGKREGIMCSCPNPSHPDKDPSAWINLDKQVWTCGGCGFMGGDMYDIAAWRFGFPVPEYKTNGDFPKLRRAMAADLGIVVKRTVGGTEYVASVPESLAEPQPEPTNVVQFPRPSTASFSEVILDKQASELSIDWESIVPPQTFLWDWMKATTVDDLPHEYYFWLGMQALGFAGGTDQLLVDFHNIKPNLYVCLYGRTGSGKSRALAPFVKLLDDSMPYDDDPYSEGSGVRILSSPASAEALLKMFSREVLENPTNKVIGLTQVKGLLRIEEFASFVARASRASNPMKETLIELFDVLKRDMRHTSITGGTITARDPFCQMVTTTQPAAIHDFLRRTDVHSGFMNRWVFATGHRRVERMSYGSVEMDLDQATAQLKILRAWGSAERKMRLEGPALQVWDRFFHGTIVPLQDTTDESMLSRLDLTLKKLILLFTINDRTDHPTAEAVERAIQLYDYLRMTYMIFSTDIAHSDFEECRMKLIEVILALKQATGQPPTMRQIGQRIGNKFSRQLVLQVIKTMTELDELQEEITSNQKGPKTVRYSYVAAD
jgi:hypothetical protein